MRRTWLAGIAGAVLVGGLSTGVVLAADPEGDKKGRPSAGAEAHADKAKDHGRGHGPPSWAHGQGSPAKGHADKAWKDAWTAMTPGERQQLMRDLAKAHADGMRDFAKCVADARGAAARADCDKPLPPGHAKREAVS